MKLKEILEQTDPDVKYTALILISENGLGSILHAIKLPLAGHLLSINQVGIINKASFESNDNGIALRVSLGGSLLKSLSPAGKKLTPMLAILAQGFLYSLPMKIFGINYISAFLGIILSSLWAFIQPLLFLYIFFGNNLYKGFEKLIKDVKPYLPNIDEYLLITIISIIVLKIVFTFLYSYLLIKKEHTITKHFKIEDFSLTAAKSSNSSKNNFILAFKDLLNPLFLISFLLTAIYFYYLESDQVQFIWNCTRPLAIAYITFYLIRIFPIEKLNNILTKYGFEKTTKTIKTLKKMTERS